MDDDTIHTLRHFSAKNQVGPNTPVDSIAALLGYESFDSTRIYIQPGERDLVQTIRRAAGEIIVHD